jgi:adenosylmethionine-8-amino-7-oxononanoate aminotransferase
VQRALRERGLIERVARMGEGLERRLRDRFGEHPNVGDIRGRGFLWAIELAADRESKRPFEPTRRLHARIKAHALDRGLLCYPMGGTIDGVRGDHVLIAPPFIATDAHLDELTDKLALAVEDALAEPAS